MNYYFLGLVLGLLGWFCLECYTCHLSMKMGESCCVPVCVPGGVIALRTKLRTEQGIQVGTDICANDQSAGSLSIQHHSLTSDISRSMNMLPITKLKDIWNGISLLYFTYWPAHINVIWKFPLRMSHTWQVFDGMFLSHLTLTLLPTFQTA